MPNKRSALILSLLSFLLLTSPLTPHAQETDESPLQIDSTEIVSPEVYTQPGFAATSRAREFAEWKERFIKDRRTFLETAKKISHDPTISEIERLVARESNNKKAFLNSIDNGKKGRSLVEFMIDAMYSPQRYGTGAGLIVARLIDNEDCRAVGYGGTG